MRSVLIAIALGVLVAVAAEAQTDPANPDGSTPLEATWSVAAGYESFWLRDVARTGPPMDASPVSWVGQGPALTFRHDRARTGRLHRFELSFASAGDFSFETPLRTIPRSSGDHVTRLEGRYEYRRYPFRDLLADGFDVGIGVQGIGSYHWLTQNHDPSLRLQQGELQLGAAVVVAARWHRWRRLDLQASWSNAAVLAHTDESHSVDPLSTLGAWGGGWLTELALTADVKVARRTAILVGYLHDGQGRISNHDSLASGRDRLTVGVTYAP